MVIGEETVVPRGIQKGITPKDPEELKREEKRIPDQNPPLHEPGTPTMPAESDEDEEPRLARDFPLPEDIEAMLAGDAEGEPIVEGPIDPEPEIDEERPGRTHSGPQQPPIDPEIEMPIQPEPDRSPGAPPDGPPGFPGPDDPEPRPVQSRH
jgi:hypothetical protein